MFDSSTTLPTAASSTRIPRAATSSLELRNDDPFDIVRNEVELALAQLETDARGNFINGNARGDASSDNSGQALTRATELDRIASDLDELGRTVRMVEAKPQNFPHISSTELLARAEFVRSAQLKLQELRSYNLKLEAPDRTTGQTTERSTGIGSPRTTGQSDSHHQELQPADFIAPTNRLPQETSNPVSTIRPHRTSAELGRSASAVRPYEAWGDKYRASQQSGSALLPQSEGSKLQQLLYSRRSAAPSGAVSRDDPFLESDHRQQLALEAHQERTLDDLVSATNRLNFGATSVGHELLLQDRLVGQVGEDIDQETAAMNSILRRMAKVFQTSDRRQLKCILLLSAAFVLLLMLVLL